VLAWLTDFGQQDSYASQMELVARQRIGPEVPLVHLCHEVLPFCVPSGAWLLKTVEKFLPPQAVVVAVVDPGVGSHRPLVFGKLSTGAEIFATGAELLAFLTLEGPIRRIPSGTFPVDASHTFHGRDVLTPLACDRYLARVKGDDQLSLWPELPEDRPSFAEFPREGDEIHATVVHVDRFGNIITAMAESELQGKSISSLLLGQGQVYNQQRTFSGGKLGEPFWYWGSQSTLEVAIFQQSATQTLGVSPGDVCRVVLG